MQVSILTKVLLCFGRYPGLLRGAEPGFVVGFRDGPVCSFDLGRGVLPPGRCGAWPSCGRANPWDNSGGNPITGLTSSISTGITIGLPVGDWLGFSGGLVCVTSGISVPFPDKVITTSVSPSLVVGVLDGAVVVER